MIVGHTVCARLHSHLTAGSDPRMEYSFKLLGKWTRSSFLEEGGKHTECGARPQYG